MPNETTEQLTSPDYALAVKDLALAVIRQRRSACQSTEESLSLQRRLVQGRLDIVQAELYRRSGNGDPTEVQDLVAQLPAILVERGDRHLGPGRLTSLGEEDSPLGDDFDTFSELLNGIVSPNRLSNLAEEDEEELRAIADQLDQLERSISANRHQLHKNIDIFQEEIVRRYKTGEASVDGLLQGSD